MKYAAGWGYSRGDGGLKTPVLLDTGVRWSQTPMKLSRYHESRGTHVASRATIRRDLQRRDSLDLFLTIKVPGLRCRCAQADSSTHTVCGLFQDNDLHASHSCLAFASPSPPCSE